MGETFSESFLLSWTLRLSSQSFSSFPCCLAALGTTPSLLSVALRLMGGRVAPGSALKVFFFLDRVAFPWKFPFSLWRFPMSFFFCFFSLDTPQKAFVFSFSKDPIFC